MNLSRKAFVLVLTSVVAFASSGQARPMDNSPPDTLEELLKRNVHTFAIGDGKLSGKGAQFFRDSLERVQFVAYGEEHNRKAIHQFGDVLFRLLQADFGFQYLAIEEDPYWAKMLSAAARRDGPDGIIKLSLRFPNAFHLFSEDEMVMIGNIGKLSNAKSDPVWGLNQVFGASHIYARLVEIAPTKEARSVAQTLLDQALEHEKERFRKNLHYVAEVSKPLDFKMLREAFKPDPGSEAGWLIDEIELSNKIYAPYFADPEPPSSVFFESGKVREIHMKDLFSAKYREAEALENTPPKVMAMFGHSHLYRGHSDRSHLYTLGNFLSEFAAFNGNTAFHFYAITGTSYAASGPFAQLVRVAGESAGDSDSGVIIDLRPVYDHARRNKEMDPRLRRMIMGHDAFVFLLDSELGSVERFKTAKFRWYPEN